MFTPAIRHVQRPPRYVKLHVSLISWGGGEGVLPYLGMVRRFFGDDPRFWDFQSDWVPFSASLNPSNSKSRSDWPLIVLIFNPIDPLFPNFQSHWTPSFEPCQIRLGSFFKLVLSFPPKHFAEYSPPPRGTLSTTKGLALQTRLNEMCHGRVHVGDMPYTT